MLGGYAGYIIPAYAASAVVIVLLVVWPMIVHRMRRAEIQALEARGYKRRSQEREKDG